MTDIRRLEEFNRELIDNVDKYADEEECSTKAAFTSVFIDAIDSIDNVEFKFQDVQIKNYRNESENMRINGYSIDSVMNTITIIVSEYSDSQNIEQMGKTEAEKLLRQGANFYIKAKSGFFDNSYDYCTGIEISEIIKSEIPEPERVYVVLLTNKIVKRFELDTVMRNKTTIQYDIWDLEKIKENQASSDIVIDLEKYGSDGISLIKVPEESELYDCYVGVISGDVLAKIYETEDYRLFEKNIRLSLKYNGKINQGIRDTLRDSPDMFVAYNNGISTIADTIESECCSGNEDIIIVKKIFGWQIVNGAQTTSTIFNVYSDGKDLKNISVQMKLVVIRKSTSDDTKKKLIQDIALYANSQNPIKKSDFSAMDEYPQTMCKLSTTISIKDSAGKSVYPWYYENARGGYDAYKKSKCSDNKSELKKFEKTTKKLTKTVAAKSRMLWIATPNIAAKGVETSYTEFINIINNDGDSKKLSKPTEDDYKKLIAEYIVFNSCDKIIKQESFGDWKSQQVCYTVALLANYHRDLIDENEIWNEQSINSNVYQKILELAYIVWDYFMEKSGSINIGQWCKKEDCWSDLKSYYESKLKAAD